MRGNALYLAIRAQHEASKTMSSVAKKTSSIRQVRRLACAASAVLLYILTGCGSENPAEEQAASNSSAMCRSSLILNGDRYYGRDTDTAVIAKPAAVRAKVPPCRDTNHGKPLPKQTVKVWTIPGVKAANGFTAPGLDSHLVFVRKGLTEAKTQEVIERATASSEP